MSQFPIPAGRSQTPIVIYSIARRLVGIGLRKWRHNGLDFAAWSANGTTQKIRLLAWSETLPPDSGRCLGARWRSHGRLHDWRCWLLLDHALARSPGFQNLWFAKLHGPCFARPGVGQALVGLSIDDGGAFGHPFAIGAAVPVEATFTGPLATVPAIGTLVLSLRCAFMPFGALLLAWFLPCFLSWFWPRLWPLILPRICAIRPFETILPAMPRAFLPLVAIAKPVLALILVLLSVLRAVRAILTHVFVPHVVVAGLLVRPLLLRREPRNHWLLRLADIIGCRLIVLIVGVRAVEA